AEEARAVLLRAHQDRLHGPARRVRSAEVRGGLAQRPRDRVADLVRHLRAAGRVEEHEAAAERGEARADGVDVEKRGAHGRETVPVPSDAVGTLQSVESHEDTTRGDELQRIYWATLAEIEALLRPPAEDDAPPLAA